MTSFNLTYFPETGYTILSLTAWGSKYSPEAEHHKIMMPPVG